ncbi:hypothetical protein SLE2022_020330 [Rubroshorea leprosula]
MQEHQWAANGGRSLVCASLAGVAVGAPLLGISTFSFIAALTLLLVSTPLLLIFGPLLLCSALFFIGTLVGFSAAATMAVVGVSSVVWMYRGLRGSVGAGGTVGERLVELSERMKEQGKEWAAYLQPKVQENSSDSLIHKRLRS